MNEDRVGYYTHRATEVRAIRWMGDNIEAVEDFIGLRIMAHDEKRNRMYVWTHCGAWRVLPGDWLVIDARRDLHAMSDLRFRETYALTEVMHHPV